MDEIERLTAENKRLKARHKQFLVELAELEANLTLRWERHLENLVEARAVVEGFRALVKRAKAPAPDEQEPPWLAGNY